MIYTSFILNGAWDMFYQKDKYESTIVPVLEKLDYEPDPQVIDAVPGYWEDMKEQFKLTPFFKKLNAIPSMEFRNIRFLAQLPIWLCLIY